MSQNDIIKILKKNGNKMEYERLEKEILKKVSGASRTKIRVWLNKLYSKWDLIDIVGNPRRMEKAIIILKSE